MLPDISPYQVSACYDFMKLMPPFAHYKFPSSDEIEFLVVNSRVLHGWHKTKGAKHKHVFAISRNSIGHTYSLVFYVAHEMIHLLQAEKGTCTKSIHNAEFRKIAKEVCRLNGFDYKVFV